jgi:ketosteroid isomerase-like protein
MIAALSLGLCAMTSPLAAQGSDTVKVSLPDVTLPPELDRVLRDYERAWRAGDAPGIAALFTEDGVLLQNFNRPIRGRAAIAAAYANHKGSPLRLRAIAYAVGDTVGYILGGYRYGNATEDMGKFTLTLRRTPGASWLIASDMDSMNAPPTPRPGRTP